MGKREDLILADQLRDMKRCRLEDKVVKGIVPSFRSLTLEEANCVFWRELYIERPLRAPTSHSMLGVSAPRPAQSLDDYSLCETLPATWFWVRTSTLIIPRTLLKNLWGCLCCSNLLNMTLVTEYCWADFKYSSVWKNIVSKAYSISWICFLMDRGFTV